jgi:hypothetical protein
MPINERLTEEVDYFPPGRFDKTTGHIKPREFMV